MHSTKSLAKETIISPDKVDELKSNESVHTLQAKLQTFKSTLQWVSWKSSYLNTRKLATLQATVYYKPLRSNSSFFINLYILYKNCYKVSWRDGRKFNCINVYDDKMKSFWGKCETNFWDAILLFRWSRVRIVLSTKSVYKGT